MLAASSSDAGSVTKEWTHKRNCATSPRQFVLFYLSLAAVSLGVALIAAWRGGWLVLPFTGLDLLVVGVAFVIHARHATDYEVIRLSPVSLVVEQRSAQRLTQFEFNPRWVRIDIEKPPRTRIVLRSGSRSVTVGAYLAPHRRETFARELRRCLAQQA
ncbi:membrane protein [Pandoraea capi]|uniref:Membrane protein n=1 Tax=Pandoraea capi TaxID=2508286 RepID=A0ABY6VXB0_9BURK|nr:DUF2244 domain-containing protein [Pandoraea capi]VVD97260.1 membrane protein [Pandoraea capi]